MKKSVIALLTAATLSSSAFAAVSDAQFQWGGLVPPVEETSPDVCIEDTGLVDHMNGVLEFTNDGENINLVDASDLSFKVMDKNCVLTDDETTSAKDIAYGYTLRQTAISFGGLTETNTESDLHGWLHITADNSELLVNTKKTVPLNADGSGKSTVLSVGQTLPLSEDSPLFPGISGQDVLVLAVLEVTNEI